jgi:hypothetical protein
MKLPFAAAITLALVCPGLVWAGPINLFFSIDPASPSVNGATTPDDVLRAGPIAHTEGTALGLVDDFFGGFFDNLDALSYGRDPIRNPLYFSVDRVAVGVVGTDVHAQAAPGVASAAGDVYRMESPGGNRLLVNETALGLTPGFFGDDLDALDMDRASGPFTFFSVDSLSAANGFGAGDLADDILVSGGGGSFSIFHEGVSEIGLLPGDDLDALILDVALNVALFSLSSFSPSTFTTTGNPYVPGLQRFLSPSDVLFTRFDGRFSLWAPAAALGLRPDDELDALDTIPDIPEPAIVSLLTSGWLAVVAYRRRLRRQASASRASTRATLAVTALIAAPVGVAAQEALTPVFSGSSPPVADSSGVLVLNEDVGSDARFQWQSSDSVLGSVDTGAITATSWRYWPATTTEPARLVFTGTAAGIMVSGNVLFEPYSRAVVDVIKARRRIRYLLTPACSCICPTGTITAQEDVEPMVKLPLGGTVASTGPACFKVYMPTKWGGKLTVSTTDGTIAGLRYPDGKPYTNGGETGRDKHGWYTFKIAGSNNYTVSNTFVQEGTAKSTPWNFWFFPNLTAAAGGSAGPRLYDNPGPYTRFDTKFTLGTTSFDFEDANHKSTTAGNWWGHCWGVALASIVFAQPAAAGGLTEDDLEGLAGEFLDNANATIKAGLLRLAGQHSALMFHFEKATAAATDSVDRLVHQFHDGMVEMLRLKEKAPLVNLRQASGAGAKDQVWNQGCFHYRAELKEDPDAAGNSETEKILQIKIKNRFACNDDFHQANVSTGNPVANPTLRREQETEYILMYGAAGTVQPNGTIAGRKQNWLSTRLTRTASGAVDREVFVPAWIFDASSTAGRFVNAATPQGANPSVRGDRLTTLGLKKNADY